MCLSLRSAARFPTMQAVQKKPDGGLRNTIYEQQTRSGRRLTRGRLLLYKMLVPLGLWRCCAWCGAGAASVHVSGARAHRGGARARALLHPGVLASASIVLRQAAARAARRRRQIGLLDQPSVDGELGAMIVRSLGGEVIRGSSTYTGARALRDYYQALAHEGISPAITPDGPRGPPWKFKPGALLLVAAVAAADHSLGLCRLARVENQLGPLRHPACRVRESRSRSASRCMSRRVWMPPGSSGCSRDGASNCSGCTRQAKAALSSALLNELLSKP